MVDEFVRSRNGQKFLSDIGRLADAFEKLSKIEFMRTKEGALMVETSPPLCEVEECEERVSTLCPKHTLSETDGAVVVDMVWVIYAVNDGLNGVESDFTVRASEQSARDIMKDRINDAEDDSLRIAWGRQLDAWDGKESIQIASWFITVQDVNL